MRARVVLLLISLGLTMGLTAAPVAAAALTVNSLADTAADDGSCTLREAITSANTDTASGASTGECAAGAGGDTISFSVIGTITLASALPDITSAISVDGASAITISGNGVTRGFTIVLGGALTLSGLTITAGLALNGGGILNSGTLTVMNSTISGNAAVGAGGGIANGANAAMTVTNSTISGNSVSSAGAVGGGLANGVNSTTTVTNSTISGNSAVGAGAVGGGILNFAATLTVTNSTISGNSAVGAGAVGGGIQANGTETLVNSIVAGNSAATDADISLAVETTTTSVIGVPVGLTLADILVPAGLADNGGSTQTIALALVTANPAIDTGTGAICAAAPVNAVDQRGLPRPALCDIGAYEAQPPTVAAHADVTTPATSAAGAVVTYTPPTGTDEQGGAATVACVPAPGSTFPIGSTTVTCTATDAVGHTGTGTFSVIVGAVAPTPAPSLPDAATTQPGASSSWITVGFAALMIGSLGVLAVANLGVVRRRLGR